MINFIISSSMYHYYSMRKDDYFSLSYSSIIRPHCMDTEKHCFYYCMQHETSFTDVHVECGRCSFKSLSLPPEWGARSMICVRYPSPGKSDGGTGRPAAGSEEGLAPLNMFRPAPVAQMPGRSYLPHASTAGWRISWSYVVTHSPLPKAGRILLQSFVPALKKFGYGVDGRGEDSLFIEGGLIYWSYSKSNAPRKNGSARQLNPIHWLKRMYIFLMKKWLKWAPPLRHSGQFSKWIFLMRRNTIPPFRGVVYTQFISEDFDHCAHAPHY